MTLPFPTRVPVGKTMLFACLLMLVQQFEKTDPLFSLLTFCFLVLSVFAFNIAGGLSRPSGAYILFYSLFVVDVGVVFKASLGEPGQTNLQSPVLMMSTYVVSMVGMLLAAFVSRNLATNPEGFAGLLHIRHFNYFESALGCLMVFLAIDVLGELLPGGGGQLVHSFTVVDPFLPLSMLLATIAAVRDSGGRRSTGALSWFVMGFGFYLGMLGFSKQGMFTPFTCWAIGCAWARFQLRVVHLILIVVFAVFAGTVLVPLAGVGRDEVLVGTTEERLGIAENHLSHIAELRAQSEAGESVVGLDSRMFYYDTRHGLLDRLTMMPNDSVLMDYSAQGHHFGYLAIAYYFQDWVPHIIAPHKLEGIRVGGNAYMHEMGGLADDDVTTGISFSPTAEAFHIDGWRGVVLLAPAIWFLLFLTADAICGDIRRQPLGLLYILIFAHIAPEGLLAGAISMIRLLNIGVILAIVFCGFVTPVLGMLLRGKHGLRESRSIPLPALQPTRAGALQT